MAEEAVEKEKDKAAAPPSKGVSMKLAALIGAGALLLGLAGTIAFFKLSGKPAPDAAQAETTGESHGGAGAKVEAAPLYDLESFIVNLADSPDVRYLKLTVKLELERPDASGDVAARLPQVRDAVLILLSSKDSIGLRSTQGKFQLRDELTQRVNNVLPHAGVKTVYFTEFVVQ